MYDFTFNPFGVTQAANPLVLCPTDAGTSLQDKDDGLSAGVFFAAKISVLNENRLWLRCP